MQVVMTRQERHKNQLKIVGLHDYDEESSGLMSTS